jgi:transcriptional regulator with GAF, ATPase, and Fis domain
MANNGTIFLDEIGELPLALQPKLLRVLQNGAFERVGGQETIQVNVRVVSATNRDLDREVRLGQFREDLYYRLKVFPVIIPPLRNRKEDIPLFIQFFTDRKAKTYDKQIENISKADMNRLCEYAWPGNVRELKNVIERSVISSDTNTLKLDWFYNGINDPSGSSPSAMERIEKEHITKILEECGWKINGKTGAASKLAMHPSTLRSRMKKLNISRPALKE